MTSDRPLHLRLVPDAESDEPVIEPAPGLPGGLLGDPRHHDPEDLYRLLADGIRGTAADWPNEAVDRLEQGLLERFGPELGPSPEAVVARLVILARNPHAA